MSGVRRISWTTDEYGNTDSDSVRIEFDDRQVFRADIVERCVVDRRPPGCVEIEPGIWFYLPFILPPQVEWRPYDPCKEQS